MMFKSRPVRCLMLLVVAVAALPATQVAPPSTQAVTPQIHSKSDVPATQVAPASTQTVTPQVPSKSDVPATERKTDAVEHKAAPTSISSPALPTLTVTAKQTEITAAPEHAGTITVNQTETVTPEARAKSTAEETTVSAVETSSVSSESAVTNHITLELVAASVPESSSSAASSTDVPSASVQAAKSDLPEQVSSASSVQQEVQRPASEASKVQNSVPETPLPTSHASAVEQTASTVVSAPIQSMQPKHSASPPAQNLAPASEIPVTQRLHPTGSSIPSQQSHSVSQSPSSVGNSVQQTAAPNTARVRRKRQERGQGGSGTRQSTNSVLSTPQENASMPARRQCANPLQRKAWQSFSDPERRAYIDAELCLMTQRQAETGAPGAESRYDDLIAVHQLQASWVHLDGWFLPFHRYLIWTHERLLREECGYVGAQPYWDETLDARDFANSEVFRGGDTGFGGNGDPRNGNCIRDGPFASYTLHIGPAYEVTDHCISRAFEPQMGNLASEANVDTCLQMDRFENMWPCLEGVPHVAGHAGVGGVMNDAVASPGDPLFWLHHTFIDMLWSLWQSVDPATRHRQIAGFTTAQEPRGGFVPARLTDEMNMHGLAPTRTILELMDHGDLLCYEYI